MKLESKLGQFSQEGGFTLIEMLIVVAIIAILVAIAVPALNNAKTDAQAAKLASAKSAVALAKNRVVLAATNDVSGSTATISTLSSYLLINGVAPTADSDILAGTGKAAITYGTNSQAATFN